MNAPLTRENVTLDARRMIPAFVALAIFLGLLYIVDPQGRVQRTPGLAGAREIMPMTAWGVVFLIVAAIMIIALLTHRRTAYLLALWFYGIAAVLWALIFLYATKISPEASYGSPAYPLFVAWAARATALSVTRDSRTAVDDA